MSSSVGMMFCDMTNLFRNLFGFFVGYINSLGVTNILMVSHTMLSAFRMANLRPVLIMMIVTAPWRMAVFMFIWLMANFFLNMLANFLGNIFTMLDLLVFNDSFVNCLVMGFTLLVGTVATMRCTMVWILIMASWWVMWSLIMWSRWSWSSKSYRQKTSEGKEGSHDVYLVASVVVLSFKFRRDLMPKVTFTSGFILLVFHLTMHTPKPIS